MKFHTWVSYGSFVIILALTLLLLAPLAFGSPNPPVAWRPLIIFLTPAIALVALLFMAPRLSTVLLFGAVDVLLTIVGWMPAILLGIFLLACISLYISRKDLPAAHAAAKDLLK